MDGIYMDTNKGMYLVRQVIDPPLFKMSVHNRDYDYVRYDTIYVKGRYYEHAVKQRFDIILSQPVPVGVQSVVMDVGANIGYYTMVAAAHGHEVVSFEINPGELTWLVMC